MFFFCILLDCAWAPKSRMAREVMLSGMIGLGLYISCQNPRNFDAILPGVSPLFSGIPSGGSEVLRCGSVESMNRGLLPILCM